MQGLQGERALGNVRLVTAEAPMSKLRGDVKRRARAWEAQQHVSLGGMAPRCPLFQPSRVITHT